MSRTDAGPTAFRRDRIRCIAGKTRHDSNSIVVNAGAQAPRLLRLADADGNLWEGLRADSLIDHATVRGMSQRLRWHLNASLSHSVRGEFPLSMTTQMRG